MKLHSIAGKEGEEMRQKWHVRIMLVLAAVLFVTWLGENITEAAPGVLKSWKIISYTPQAVSQAVPVLVSGKFPAQQGTLRIKLGKGKQVIKDVSGAVSSWSAGSFRLNIWPEAGPGIYWLAITDDRDTLLAKGPETLQIDKTISLAPGPDSEQKPPMSGLRTLPPAELEIQNMLGLSQNVCPNKNFNLSLSIRNNGDTPATFHICTVGSKTYGCMVGVPQTFTLQKKASSWFAIPVTPDPAFIEGGSWHGKVFLGKVAGPSQDTGPVTLQGSQTNTTSDSDCNVVISTSWGSGQGLAAGGSFCDKNMNNHLRILTVPSDPNSCGPRRLVR